MSGRWRAVDSSPNLERPIPDRAHASVKPVLKPLLDATALFLQRHPGVLRTGLTLAQRILPRRASRQLIVSQSAVAETFRRAEVLQMGHLNAPKLKLGTFLLGMDPPDERYAFEKQALTAALVEAPVLAARFARVDAEHTARALASQRTGHALELGASYAQAVYARALGHAFGVPARGAPCPGFGSKQDPEPLARYIQVLGGTIGSDHPAPFGLEGRALEVAPYFREHLIHALAAHRDGSIRAHLPSYASAPAPQVAQTVLGQLLATHPFRDGDEGILRNVAGMLSASASFPYVFSSILHELLRRPEHMRRFARALIDGDEAQVLAYAREALRFRPPFPMLVRFCPHHARLAATSAVLERGAQVPFFPAAAMFDVERPHELDVARPESSYFLFGGAPRECVGKDLITSLFMPLFRGLALHLPEVFEAAPGRFRFAGPTLAGYTLELPAQLSYALRPAVSVRPESRPVYALEPLDALPALPPLAADDLHVTEEHEPGLRGSCVPDPVN